MTSNDSKCCNSSVLNLSHEIFLMFGFSTQAFVLRLKLVKKVKVNYEM